MELPIIDPMHRVTILTVTTGVAFAGPGPIVGDLLFALGGDVHS